MDMFEVCACWQDKTPCTEITFLHFGEAIAFAVACEKSLEFQEVYVLHTHNDKEIERVYHRRAEEPVATTLNTPKSDTLRKAAEAAGIPVKELPAAAVERTGLIGTPTEKGEWSDIHL